MMEEGEDELTSKCWDEVEAVTTAGWEDLELNSKEVKHDKGHTESWHVGHEHGDRHDNLIESTSEVSSNGTK